MTKQEIKSEAEKAFWLAFNLQGFGPEDLKTETTNDAKKRAFLAMEQKAKALLKKHFPGFLPENA